MRDRALSSILSYVKVTQNQRDFSLKSISRANVRFILWVYVIGQTCIEHPASTHFLHFECVLHFK
jgi:hypothetical protein